MSDTPENQAEYPQHANQEPGCGFPIAKIVVMFSLATGAAEDVLIAPFRTGEVTLARQLYPKLVPGDVVIYVHLMAYNLLRTVMWQAGKQAGVCPVRISLQGTRQHFGHFCCHLYQASPKKRLQLYDTLLKVVTDKLLPERPYRYEPRLKKQRPKPYGWIQQPRTLLKRKLAA